MNEELKIELGVNEWLKLIEEDKNLNGAYISICQYIYLTEKENKELKKQLEDMTLCRDIASGHREEVQDREVILLNQQKEFIKWLEDYLNLFDYDQISCDMIEEILQKYKSIIGADK